MTNIASGETEHVVYLIQNDVLKHYIPLLNSPNLEIVDQVVWGLGNMAGDSSLSRDYVIESGVVDLIAAVLDNCQVGSSLQRNASWALSNLCRGRPSPQYQKVRRAIPSLTKVVIECNNDEIITDCCWALSYLSDGSKERIQDFIDQNLLKKMISLLGNEKVAISVPCLRTVGNIVTGDETQTQIAIDAGIIQGLDGIIMHQKKAMRKDTCWVLSNLTAGTSQQLQACIDSGIIDKTIEILKKDEM